ncbi:transporter, cation channel family protein [Cardiosporidium cionae]|uniref:Transporter, cation channel family protein n=1 Tax=Cardiosporidium cionae TaxID=476202 RepID=A0ABQ7J9P4_9APIC|nr:transporter, cation channel family protein [Cardiosporidium cionae]|eukprot:KAF8820733.1 transporter, cation channel family protein [Cardiosporidium cionae]
MKSLFHIRVSDGSSFRAYLTVRYHWSYWYRILDGGLLAAGLSQSNLKLFSGYLHGEFDCSALTLTIQDQGDEAIRSLWGTLLSSMFTLFTVLTLEGWNEVAETTAKFYPSGKLFLVAYVCFATLTVMNVVMGIILDTYLKFSKKLSAEPEYRSSLERHHEMNSILSKAFSITNLLSNSPKCSFARQSRIGDISEGLSPIRDDLRLNHARVVSIGNLQEYASEKEHSEHVRTNEGYNVTDSTSLKPVFGNIFRQNDKGELLDQEKHWKRGESDCCKWINLKNMDLTKIVLEPEIYHALQKASIAPFQAFEVLRLHRLYGFDSLSVEDFASACEYIDGECSGRQLLHFQLEISQRLRKIDTRLKTLSQRCHRTSNYLSSFPLLKRRYNKYRADRQR